MLVCTLNSCTASGGGETPKPPNCRLRESTPSISVLLLADRAPLAAYEDSLKGTAFSWVLANPPLSVVVPGTKEASAPKRRRFKGRSTTSRSPITVPTLAVLVSTSGAAPLTFTSVATSPTTNCTSTGAFWSTSSLMPVSTVDLNPIFSTATE